MIGIKMKYFQNNIQLVYKCFVNFFLKYDLIASFFSLLRRAKPKNIANPRTQEAITITRLVNIVVLVNTVVLQFVNTV